MWPQVKVTHSLTSLKAMQVKNVKGGGLCRTSRVPVEVGSHPDVIILLAFKVMVDSS